MNNGVGDVNSEVPPKCTLEDLEVAYKGNDAIYAVDESGAMTFEKEIYGGESYFSYYYCTNCGEGWAETAKQDQAQCWKLAKEHLNEV